MTILNSLEKEIIVDSFRVHFADLVCKFEDDMEEVLMKTLEDNEGILMAHKMDISNMENPDDGIKQLMDELKPDFVKVSKEIVLEFQTHFAEGDDENA